jgi:hypothetical protein
MEVHPELSTGDVRLLGAFALPEKSVTQVTTNIMCFDGATVVIGGLIREDLNRTVAQIPLLGNLPLVGPAFRRKTAGVIRNEIIVLITPRIVFDPAAIDDGPLAASDLHRRESAVFTRHMTPIARRYHGCRYLRLARSAWIAGNAESALSYVDLALRFTPSRNEALILRDEILSTAGGVIAEAPLPPEEMAPDELIFPGGGDVPGPRAVETSPVAPTSYQSTSGRPYFDLGSPPTPPPLITGAQRPPTNTRRPVRRGDSR